MGKIIFGIAILLISASAAAAQQQIKINLHWITDSHGCKIWDTLPSPGETVSWTGTCDDGYADGSGKLVWYLHGKPHGTYEGDMKGGHYDGHGVQIWSTGARYEGEWKNDRADGKGIYRSASGEVCSGVWANGCFQGAGCSHSVGAPECPPH